MKCVKCQSENVVIHSERKKPSILFCSILVDFGLVLMIFGVVGCIFGALVGLIIGSIVKVLLQYRTISIAVCQNCGKSWNVKQCG